MSSNHLATQAKRIIHKELIAKTKRTVPEKSDDKVTEDTNDRDRNESIRADEQVPQEQPTTTKQKTNKRHTTRADKNDPKLDEGHHPHDKRVNEEELGRIVDEIRPEWIRNYEKFLNIEIEDRLYLTKKDRRIEDIELLPTNKIIDETIEREGKNINLWKINVMQYVTAITLLAKHGKLRKKKVIYKEKKTDGWILNIENKINAIRRKLSHVNLIFNNKDPKELTPRQHHIKRRLKKMNGSSKRTRLIEVQARLKHDLEK